MTDDTRARFCHSEFIDGGARKKESKKGRKKSGMNRADELTRPEERQVCPRVLPEASLFPH